MKRLSLVALLLVSSTAWSQERGVVVVQDEAEQPVQLYSQSHALLIGVSDYTAGWPDLESIPGELQQVRTALEAQGFDVVTHLNPDQRALERAFVEFIDAHGFEPDNRLLFFFSGHGHTWQQRGRGYLVPTDAPLPAHPTEYPGSEFLRKALPMSQILAWTRELNAKHALFLFDSCFSGTIFKTRALPDQPSRITRATSLPVVQFITAGSAGETVPARSIFTPAFVDALNHGWADLFKDGYITGVELGLYLTQRIPDHGPQSPQFGKHPDYELSRGDFVFQLAGRAAGTESPPATGTGTSTPPRENPKVAVEKLAGKWLAAWLGGDADTFASVASEPFFFDQKIMLTRAQVRAQYLDLLAEKGDTWSRLQIDSIKVQTIRELKQDGYDVTTDRIYSSLNLTEDDYAVTVLIGGEGLILMARGLADGRFEIVGTWD